jgi:hypothetical protein
MEKPREALASSGAPAMQMQRANPQDLVYLHIHINVIKEAGMQENLPSKIH